MVTNWILAFRPKTLTAAVVPILVGSALVYFQTGSLVWWVSLCALFSSLSIQVATNLLNDAIDFEKGADTHERIGPKRVSQSGLISSRTVMRVGFLFLLLAVVFGVPLVVRGGAPIVAIGLVSIFLAYSYTGGFFPLAYLGLGDIFVILFFGFIAVMGLNYLLVLEWSLSSAVAGFQVGALATVLIAINNFRDVNQDRLVGKRTWAVRFGPQFVRYEIAILILTTFFMGLYWGLQAQNWWAALLPFLMAPLGVQIIRTIWHAEPSDQLNRLLARSAGLQIGFGLLLSLGLVLARVI